MKILYITLLFTVIITSARGQKINFADTTNSWLVRTKTLTPGQGQRYDSFFEHYYYKGDTTINSILYYGMRRYDSKSKMDRHQGFVRFDSVDNMVYIAAPTGDIVLYDYNLALGDTFDAPFSTIYPGLYYTVTLVDSVLLNNVYHKRFQLQVTDSAFMDLWGSYQTFAEGMGCLTAPFDHLSGDRKLIIHNEIERHLYCFKTQDSFLSQHCSDTHVKELLSVGEYIATATKMQLYPQPAASKVNIQLPAKIQSGSVAVYNQLGQVVISNAIANKDLLEINNPGNLHGLYYYRVTDNTGNKVYSGKMIFE